MSDDIPQMRRRQAEAADATAEVPAGGRGADSGAVESTGIDASDRAPLQNISSQNDIAGVGTRGADGSIESGVERERPRRSARTAEQTPASRHLDDVHAPEGAEEQSSDSLVQRYEPGVDAAHARDSRAAGPAASDGDPGSVDERPGGRGAALADRAGSRWALLPAGIVGVVAIVLFAFAVPVAPAVAWIAIALEVALFAVLVVSAAGLRAGRYRRLSVLVPTIGMMAVAVVFAVILLVLGISS
jgi:hypothetical protein